MAWLVCDDRVLATVEFATGWRERALGLLGRDEYDKALLLRPAFSVHTLGMRFPIDVAYLDRDLVVLKAATMARFRVGLPVVAGAGGAGGRGRFVCPVGAKTRRPLAGEADC